MTVIRINGLHLMISILVLMPLHLRLAIMEIMFVFAASDRKVPA